MLEREYDDRVGQPCPTSGCKRIATVRCRECAQLLPICEGCIVEAHRNHPLHWVERWNGLYFDRTDLANIGLTIYLGHDGLPCPNLPRQHPKPTDIVIVHLNGVHRCKLQLCHCVNRPSLVDQLMRVDYFPASLHRIETAFTMDTLNSYDILFNLAKVSGQDYCRWLGRLTSNASPQDVPVSKYWPCS